MKKFISLLLAVSMLFGMFGNVAIAAGITPTANLISVAYSEKLDLYVTVASDGQLYTSGDGINWGPGEKLAPSINLGTIVGNGYYVTPDAIIWNPDSEEFVLAAGNKLYRSSDGFNWGEAITPKAGSTTLVIHTLFWDGSKYWAATTTGGQVAFANDNTLTSWTASSTGANKAIDGFAKAPGGRVFVCTTLANSKTLYYTDNGTTWTDGTTSGVNPYRTTSIGYSPKAGKIFLAGGVASDKASTKNGAVGRADVTTGVTEARIELKADANNAANIPVVSDFVVYDTYDSSNIITKEEIIAVSFTGAISYREITSATDITSNRKWKAVSPATGETANTLGLTSVVRGKNGYVAVGGDPSNWDRTGTGGVAIFIPTDYTQGYTVGKFDDNTTKTAYSLCISGADETEIPASDTVNSTFTVSVRDISGKAIQNPSNTINWTVTGDDLTGITIANGVLSVASDAKEQTIVITATDSSNATLTAQKKVVIKSSVPGIENITLFRDNLTGLTACFSVLSADYIDGENCTKWYGTDPEQTQMWIDGSFAGAGSKNLVASVSFYPTDTLNDLFFATTSHNPIHERSINSTNWVANKWNTMSVIINPETNKNSLYLNGKFISEYEYDVSDTLRLVAWAKDNNLPGATVYIDDFCINEGVYTLPLITTDLTISGDNITNLLGKTNSEVKQAITINDPRFTANITYNGSEVSDSATVLNGSKLTITQKNNFVGEYVLKTSKPLTNIVSDRDGAGTTFGAKYSTVEDALLNGEPCMVMTGTELQDGGNQMFLYTGDSDIMGNADKDLVFSFSVYPTSSIKHIMIATSGHASIVPVILASDLTPGKWNEISVVIDGATSTNTLYLNGKFVERRVAPIKSSTLRLCIYSSQEVLEGTTAYIDNLTISEGSATFPAINSTLILDGMYINGFGGMTYANVASALTGINPDTTYKFFEEGTEVSNLSAQAQSGAHVSVFTGGEFVSEYILGTANYSTGEFTGYSDGIFSDKFGLGTYKAQVEVSAFGKPLNAMAVLAQYNNKGMINCNVRYHTLSGNDVADVSLDIEEVSGTYLKYFLFEQGTLKPLLKDAVTIQPYSDVYVESIIPLYEGYTTKAATFSYDDGVADDINTIASLNKYGAKATFNVVAKQTDGTTDRLLNYYKKYGSTQDEIVEYIKDLYNGHEIANHTYSHPAVQLEEGQTSQDSGGNTLTGVSGDTVISQIADNHSYIKDIFGVEMTGIAWSYSGPYNRSDYTTIRDAILNSGYKYARHHTNSMSFDLPGDWFKWSTSAHIAKMPELTDKFVALSDDGNLKLLYIWGHSYEYANPERYGSGDWTTLEENLKKLSDAGVWFATNKEVYDYVNAVNKITSDINTVTNNSDITVYVQINGKNVELGAGETYNINQSQENLPVIACWGDSLTWGQGSSEKFTKSYPGILASLSGATVYNMGVGGETSTTIAAKQGALDIVFTQEFTIPASCDEKVEIKFKASNGGVVTPRSAEYGGWTPCTINGIDGKMEIVVDSSVWPRVLTSAHFKRNVSGEAVKVNIGDKLVPYAQTITPDINIIFSGTNGGWTSKNTTVPSDYSADIPEFLNLLDSQRKLSNNPDKYIIIGLTAGDEARWGALDSAMESKFGDNFLDLRAYLSSEAALEMAGIEPTESDFAAIETGAVPPSFLVSDGTHFNDAGYELIAQCVYEKLTKLGYLN